MGHRGHEHSRHPKHPDPKVCSGIGQQIRLGSHQPQHRLGECFEREGGAKPDRDTEQECRHGEPTCTTAIVCRYRTGYERCCAISEEVEQEKRDREDRHRHTEGTKGDRSQPTDKGGVDEGNERVRSQSAECRKGKAKNLPIEPTIGHRVGRRDLSS